MFSSIKQILRKQRLKRAGIDLEVRRETAAYGERTGVWTVLADLLPEQPLVYSFGVGKNIDWDLQMVQRHGAELHAFDPTPRSISWMKDQELPAGFAFHPFGLGNRDGDVGFYIPRKPHKVNYSSVKASPGAEQVLCPVKKLSTICTELGHTRVDILKMDIEGGEMDALPDVLESGIFVGQLLAEFHYHYPAIGWDPFLDVVSELRRHGYRIFHISERGYEFSLVHASLLD